MARRWVSHSEQLLPRVGLFTPAEILGLAPGQHLTDDPGTGGVLLDEPNTVRDSTEVSTGIIARSVLDLRGRVVKSSLEPKIRTSILVQGGWVVE